MSISPSNVYNIQNHGTDYNLATTGDSLATSNSRIYVWQATACESDGSVFLVDTGAQKCLWASGTSVAVHSCVDADKQWSVRAVDRSPNTYTIYSNVGDGGNFVSTNDDGSFSLVGNETTSYAQWSFQAPSSGDGLTWNVCDHIVDHTISAPTTTESSEIPTNSSSSTSSIVTSTTSEVPSTILETPTSSGEQVQAELTAAATAANSNTMSLQSSTGTAALQNNPTPSATGVPQSNVGHLTTATWCILLAVVMASLAANSS